MVNKMSIFCTNQVSRKICVRDSGYRICGALCQRSETIQRDGVYWIDFVEMLCIRRSQSSICFVVSPRNDAKRVRNQPIYSIFPAKNIDSKM